MAILQDYRRRAKPTYAPFLSGIPGSPRLALLIGSEQILELLLSHAAESVQSNAVATYKKNIDILAKQVNSSSVFQDRNLQSLACNLRQMLTHNLTV